LEEQTIFPTCNFFAPLTINFAPERSLVIRKSILILTIDRLYRDHSSKIRKPIVSAGGFYPPVTESGSSLKSVNRLTITNAASAAMCVFANGVGDEIGLVFERHRRAAKNAEQVIVHRFFHPRLLRNFRYDIHVNSRYGFAFI
jgi:hypothetical protein